MTRILIATIGLLLAVARARAADTPDSQVNPQTGYIETVSASWNGADHDLIYTIDRGGLPPVSIGLVDGGADDVDPHLSITPSGDTWVVWTRDGNPAAIYVRGHEFGASSWDTAREVGSSAEDSRAPEIAFDGTTPVVAYEIHGGGSTSIAVAAVGDDPDPIGSRTIVASTAFSGDVDVRIHAESGHLWVTWMADATHVGFSERESDGTSWTSAGAQGIVGGDIDGAIAAVRATVLGI